MKKTLKILIAIILFAVVLTIATSVNAAVETITVDEFVNELNKGLDEANYVVTNKDGILSIKDTVVVPDGKTLVLGDIILDIADGEKITGNVQVNGTVVAKGTGTVEGKIIVNKTLYAAGAEPTSYVINGEGIIYSEATKTVADAVALELAEKVKAAPVNAGALTEYGFVVVTKESAKANTTITLGNPYVEDATEDATEIEAKKEYFVKAKAEYKKLELKASQISAEAFQSATVVPNCTGVACNDGIVEFTVADDAEEGNEVRVTVKVAAADVSKELTVKVGAVTPAPEQPEQPEEPTNPEDPTNPDQPANPDAPKGDLDDAASVATGDHIIPATALLAVVVVANVVYFAKMKNN